MSHSNRPTLPADGKRSWAPLLGLAFFALYVALYQHRLYGDGPRLVQAFSWPYGNGDIWHWPHALYPLLVRGVLALPFVHSAAQAMALLSPLAGALGVGLLFAGLRHWRCDKFEAALLASLVGFSPVLMFFSSAIEVHTPQFAAACLALYLSGRLSRSGSRLALGSYLASLALLTLTHKTGVLLMPAFVVLGWFALWRAERLTRGTKAVVLAGSSASLGLAIWASYWLNRGVKVGNVENDLQLIGKHWNVMGLDELGELFLQPAGMLWLLPFAVLLRCGWRQPRMGVLLLGLVPGLAVIVLWGVPELGAYTIGMLPVLALAVAQRERGAMPTRFAAIAGVALLLGQGTLGIRAVRAYDDGSWQQPVEARATQVRALLPNGGVLITCDAEQQSITVSLSDVVELNLAFTIREALIAGHTPVAHANQILGELAKLLESGAERIALEKNGPTWAPTHELAVPFLEAIEDALDAKLPGEKATGQDGLAVWDGAN